MLVSIIEDNAHYRESLSIALSTFDDCKIIHELPNALHITERFSEELPDVALVDINLPGISGIEAVRIITCQFPSVQCIMLTQNTEMDMVMKSIENGAKGYLVKHKDGVQKIIDSIRMLCTGNYNEEFPLNGTIAYKLIGHMASEKSSRTDKLKKYSLTSRQTEIIMLLYEGKSYKQVADEINISTETLNSHIKAIYRKLHINSRNELKNVLG